MRREPTLYRAAAAIDAIGIVSAPACLLIETDAQGLRVLAVGAPDDVLRHPAAANRACHDLGETILTPGLVNCHTHLDLTHVGPRPFDPAAEFRVWLDMVLTSRATDPAAIAASVALGVRRSESGGVVAVGDIAGMGRREATHALQSSRLHGVSFLEFFGMGNRQEASIQAMRQAIDTFPPHPRTRVGVQPHAPYSAGLRVYAAAAELARSLGVPISTHLAESTAEHEFIASGTGPMRGLLERLGGWDDSILSEVGRGVTPVDHLVGVLATSPWLVAHCNDLSDADIDRLAATQTTVAYCPRSSSYFGHHLRFGPHRYSDLLNAGVRVVLGTDSIINTPPEHADRLTPLDDARLLHQRDGADPRTLLRMMTTDGAAALGLDTSRFTFPRGKEGLMPGIAAVNVRGTPPMSDPFQRIMRATGPAPLLGRG